MERLLVKKFVNWLADSEDDVIYARRDRCETELNNPNIKSEETKSDIRLCIRLIDEEISARLEVFGTNQKRA